jgi:hypothetical protein
MQYQNLLKCAPAIESLAKVAIFEIFATKLQTIVKIELEKIQLFNFITFKI